MATCKPFTLNFQESADDLLSRANIELTNIGGTLSGDINDGSFSVPTFLGPISGNYTIIGQAITIDITHRPGLIGCGRIRSELDDRF